MSQTSFSETDLADDPVEMFSRWFAAAVAAGQPEPEAMALATADAYGTPAVRFVLLKGWDADGFEFYTNAESPKARDLRANPAAALALRWARLERQVRVAGTVEELEPARSDSYFASRPRGSQLGAWASAQSQPIAGRRLLDERLAETEARFAGRDVPRPPHWGGWRVRPRTVEFWQAGADRLHDRLRYERTAGGGWTAVRLSP